jgi:hypothetical protein
MVELSDAVDNAGFDGARLSGEVVSGNDWQAVHTDSCIKLDVRACVEDAGRALIVMPYQRLRAGPPNIIERLDRGEPVDYPGSYYFRMNPWFEAGAWRATMK